MPDPACSLLSPPPLRSVAWLRDGIILLCALTLAGWLLARGAEDLGYHWQWYQVPRHFGTFTDAGFAPGPLLLGLGTTLRITAAGLVLALAFGLSSALLALSRSVVGRGLARAYVEAIRNTPLLIQLFFVYFVLAPIFGMGATTAAVLALSLFEGAYASEIIRAGILAIPTGQWEAAESLGLTRRQAYRHVILPQAVRRILPPLASLAVSLVKDSALASTIAIPELAMQAQVIVSRTFLAFEIWFSVALVYLAFTSMLALLVNRLEIILRPAYDST